jgi:hypothetical protein
MGTLILTLTLALILVAGVAGVYVVARRKNADLIVRSALSRRRETATPPVHIFFAVVDHFEPFWKNDDVTLALERVRRWRERYPAIAAQYRDRGGKPPRHAFFYPAEDYDRSPACVEMLAEIVRMGVAEVEVHLHHDHDTAANMRAVLRRYTHTLREQHGLLRDGDGGPAYAFIHGNWVLGNSGEGGTGCGVDDELIVLDETGCYADFTLPSAPHPSQPPVINRIYYAAGDRRHARAHFRGVDAAFGRPGSSGPLIITGPLAIDWKQRRRGVLPAIENGDLTGLNPPSPARVDAWIRGGIHVAGFPRWIFVKTHTHGAQERNSTTLLGDGAGSLSALFADLVARYNDGERYVLHFSTPWEMYRAVKVLEANDTAAVAAIERFEFPF